MGVKQVQQFGAWRLLATALSDYQSLSHFSNNIKLAAQSLDLIEHPARRLDAQQFTAPRGIKAMTLKRIAA